MLYYSFAISAISLSVEICYCNIVSNFGQFELLIPLLMLLATQEDFANLPQGIAGIVKSFNQPDSLHYLIIKKLMSGRGASGRLDQTHHQIILQRLPGNPSRLGCLRRPQ